MKDKKVYIVLIAIILIFFLIMFLVFGLDEIRKESYDTTIIVEDDTVWTYKNKGWSNLSVYDDLNWKKYDVYLDNKKNNNYYLWYSDKWYVFNAKKEAVKRDGKLLAIKTNHDISVYDFEASEIEDYAYVNEVLEDNGLSTDNKYTVKKKIVLDYDNDGIEEEFYLISNTFSLDYDPDKVFSIVFMVKNDEIYPIYTDISENTGFNGCRPYISSFIDVDSDSKYEFILSCAKYSVSGVTRMLYEYKNNEFKILISNNK